MQPTAGKRYFPLGDSVFERVAVTVAVNGKTAVPLRGYRRCFACNIQEKKWLGRRDSNPTYLIQNQAFYR